MNGFEAQNKIRQISLNLRHKIKYSRKNICDKDLFCLKTIYTQFKNFNVFGAGSKVQFNSQEDSSRDRFRGAQIPHLRAVVCPSVFKLAIG
jgi:hypothetical protein